MLLYCYIAELAACVRSLSLSRLICLVGRPLHHRHSHVRGLLPLGQGRRLAELVPQRRPVAAAEAVASGLRQVGLQQRPSEVGEALQPLLRAGSPSYRLAVPRSVVAVRDRRRQQPPFRLLAALAVVTRRRRALLLALVAPLRPCLLARSLQRVERPT